jgi:hypothetical protein
MPAGPFPLPFPSLGVLRGGKDGAYLVCSMFTQGYDHLARRLAASCDSFGLQYEMHQVSTVHRSISGRDEGDVACTKANFIRHMLAQQRKPVLYVDADCEFLSAPVLIDELVRTRRDFAIYNWCADPANERFVPMEVQHDGNPTQGRFYRCTGTVTSLTNDQLICSGLVQFYGNSPAARALLRKWHQTIVRYPGCADDLALDFTFNNLSKLSWIRLLLRPFWLPQSYARIAWWIFAEPVINHAQIPCTNSTFVEIEHPTRQRFYRSAARLRDGSRPFFHNCVVDTKQGLICEVVDGKLVRVGETKDKVWL